MYLRLVDGVPEKYSIERLRLDNPNVSFPVEISTATLAEFDVYPYSRPARPEYDRLTAKLVDADFLQSEGGSWLLPYAVEQLPLADAEQNVRAERTRLLAETDWVVVFHTEQGTNIPLEWEAYRQALRDVPEQTGFPYQVVWPTKPT
jgi:hypothetical protein